MDDLVDGLSFSIEKIPLATVSPILRRDKRSLPSSIQNPILIAPFLIKIGVAGTLPGAIIGKGRLAPLPMGKPRNSRFRDPQTWPQTSLQKFGS